MKNVFAQLLIVNTLCLATALYAGAPANDRTTGSTIPSDSSNEGRQLFNGKDLTGWKHVGDGYMTVENGLIQGHGGMGLLYWTGEKFGNCTIRVVYRMRDTNSNS
jgi:3-keto-disaccharide hydrolase